MFSSLLQALIYRTQSFLKDRNGTYTDYRPGLFAIAVFFLVEFVWSRFPAVDQIVAALHPVGIIIAAVAGITLAWITAVILIKSHSVSPMGDLLRERNNVMLNTLQINLLKVRNFLTDKAGANMPEYALIAVLVALAAVAAFTDLGRQVVNKIGEVAGSI